MNRIVAYRILYASSTGKLEKLVEKYLELHWEPIGGVSGDKYDFFQAVIGRAGTYTPPGKKEKE